VDHPYRRGSVTNSQNESRRATAIPPLELFRSDATDDTGKMKHRSGAAHEVPQRVAISQGSGHQVQRAIGDPARSRRLPDQDARPMAGVAQRINQM
jgi:hypothetical protein